MSWIAIAVGSASSVACASGVVTALVKLGTPYLRRLIVEAIEEKIEPNNKATAEVKMELAKQFGGNSGGMRQAINELAVSVARNQGVLEQHIRESAGK